MSEITEVGIEIFNALMSFVQGILFLDPVNFRDGSVWDAVVNVNFALVPVTATIVIITFLLSLYDESIAELNRSTVFRYGLRFCFALAVSGGSTGIVTIIIVFGNWVASEIVSVVPGGRIEFTIPQEIIDALNHINVLDPSSWATVNIRIVIQIAFFLICVGSSIVVTIAVFTRLFKLYIMGALAPIPLAFAGAGSGHELGRIPWRFVNNFIGQSFQVAIIWVLMFFFNLFMNHSINVVAANSSQELLLIVLWMAETTIYMVVLVVMIKGADRLAAQFGFG